MNNKNALAFFEELAISNPDKRATKFYADGKNDFTDIDAAFILQYADKNTSILDIASGPGLIVNKIFKNVGSIVAVEKYESFTRHIVKSSNVRVVNSDINDFNSDDKFDLITMFAIMQYFDRDEAKAIYSKYRNFLKDNGKIIIKNQFGLKEDVIVSGFSEELKKDYFSQYRHVDAELEMLGKAGFKNGYIVDIYPPECNRWENTHFYAIVAEK